jgi:hypothetical protein
VALNDDMLCRLGILKICVNLYRASKQEGEKEFGIDIHHPNPESDIEYTQARLWHSFQKEAGSFTHCNNRDRTISNQID